MRFYSNLNHYSWLIIAAYIGASLSMQTDTGDISLEGFSLGLPIIGALIYWSEHSAPLIKKNDFHLKKTDLFYRDIFLINYSLILGDILSLLFQYNNSDARGWWTLFLYFSVLYNLLFAFIFSLIALMLKSHKLYTLMFSCSILIIFTFSKFWPYSISLAFIGNTNTFLVIMCFLLIAHLLFCVMYKLIRLIQFKLFN